MPQCLHCEEDVPATTEVMSLCLRCADKKIVELLGEKQQLLRKLWESDGRLNALHKVTTMAHIMGKN